VIGTLTVTEGGTTDFTEEVSFTRSARFYRLLH